MKQVVKKLTAITAAFMATVIPASIAPLQLQAAAPKIEYAFYGYYMADTTFVPPHPGKYRIICVGRSGNGGSGGSGGYANYNYEYSGEPGGSGAGGSSGAIAISDLTITAPVEMTFTNGVAKFGNLLWAEAGADGGSGGNGSYGKGQSIQFHGAAGLAATYSAKAYGGNVANREGYAGGNGGGVYAGNYINPEEGQNGGGKISENTKGMREIQLGGGGGRYPSIPEIDKYLQPASAFAADGFCGGGGYGSPNTGYYESPANGGPGKGYLTWRDQAIVLTGGGGGGASGGGVGWSQVSTSNRPNTAYGGAGGVGQPAVIIVEKALDDTAPVVSPVSAPTTWSTSAQITLSASDSGTGVAQYAITQNAATPSSWQASNIFNLTANGTYYAWAIDHAGNVSTPAAFTLAKIDRTNPTIKSVTVPNTWAKSSTISIAAEDLQSGIAAYAYTTTSSPPSPLVWQAGNTFTFSSNGTYFAWVKDNVGNLTSQSFVISKVDTAAPVVASCNFVDGGLSATITANDTGGSGIKGIYINNTLISGSVVNYTIPRGVLHLVLQAEDNAGNKSLAVTEAVPDTIPPVITSVVFSPDNKTALIDITDEGGSRVKGITINGEYFDALSGTTEYDIPTGTKYLELQAEDHIGNKSDLLKKRVPGWWEVVDTITIDPLEFLDYNTRAKITASNTNPDTTIAGIFVNDVLYTGNPVFYRLITDGTGGDTLTLQAINNEGDKSVKYTCNIPVWSNKLKVLSVIFSPKNDAATIKAVDGNNVEIKGFYINEELIEGHPLVYDIDSSTKYLKVQAVNQRGDVSEVVTKRVPGWSESVSTLQISSVEFSESIVKITAESSGAAVSGIYVNDKLASGNPVMYTMPNNTKLLKLQALNVDGDFSEIVYQEVPDDTPIVSDSLRISNVNFDKEGLAKVTAESTGEDIAGIYINDKLFDGNPVMYSIPTTVKALKLQAIDVENHVSPVLYKEIPTRSPGKIVDTLWISDIKFENDLVTIAADSSTATVSGIYINDKLFDGNPVICSLTSSAKTLKLQALNSEGDKSPIVYKEVPQPPSSSSSSSSSSSRPSNSSSGKSRISIAAPGWTNASKAKVSINVSDPDGVDVVEAETTYGYAADITDQSYIYINKDTTVTVSVTNGEGTVTRKSLDITCFDHEAPVVTVTQTDNILNIRATDNKSGVAAVIVNGKSYTVSGGQYRYKIPDNVKNIFIQAEDVAKNVSETIDYTPEKSKQSVPLPSTTMTVKPTPIDPPPTSSVIEVVPEPVPELDEPVVISEPEEEAIYDLIPYDLQEENKAGGLMGLIAGLIALLGGGGYIAWYFWKRAHDTPVEGLLDDEDYDYEYVDKFEAPATEESISTDDEVDIVAAELDSDPDFSENSDNDDTQDNIREFKVS